MKLRSAPFAWSKLEITQEMICTCVKGKIPAEQIRSTSFALNHSPGPAVCSAGDLIVVEVPGGVILAAL